MFVDASGDDGYKFKESSSSGSSYSFVVSCFVTIPQELEYNKQILLNMKRKIFIKPEQEIKSTMLKRHRNASLVYDEMTHLHGFAYSLIADKRLLQTSPDYSKNRFEKLSFIAKNDLSGITHTFPYISLRNSNRLSDEDKVLIVIDNMKKREMDSIKDILKDAPKGQYDLIFRDSKDKDFSLIQIADIFAGTVRTYYESCLPLKIHNRYCNSCFTLTLKKKTGVFLGKCRDKKAKKLYLPYVSDSNFNIVMSFHNDTNSKTALGEHFFILPTNQMSYFAYIDCIIFNKCPWN